MTMQADVAARIQRMLAERDTTLKALVNEALRRGLEVMERPSEARPPYRIEPRSLGRCLVPSIDSVAEVLAWGEGEAFK